jgi:hypothetical protein
MLNFGRPITEPIWRVKLSCPRLAIGCIDSSKFLTAPGPLLANGGGEGVRTPDLRLAKPALCQTELRPQSISKRLVAGAGFEPATFGL